MALNCISILQLAFFTLGCYLDPSMLRHRDLVIHFDCCVVFLHIAILNLFIHFSTNGHLGCFLSFSVANSASVLLFLELELLGYRVYLSG